ncbi:MAG TPA: zf-HC2 domain-containing protein [Gemmataceae bacterium]|nr:zf-HC2 domain-containing protein [Gemmataceae bacterium]
MNSFEPTSPCERASRQLPDLRDGLLDAVQAEALRAHLEACPYCREDQAWDDRLRDLLHELPLPAPRGRFGEQVRRRLRRRWWWRAGGSVAAAALLAVGLVSWQNWPRRPQEPVADHPGNPPVARRGDELPDSAVLFAAPPVDSLDLLARQQAGYVAVLEQLGKE